MFELLADEYARTILTTTTDDSKSATMLARELDAAQSTVYDRINRLLEFGLLEESTQIRSDGNHFATYRANLKRLNLELTADGFQMRVETKNRDAAADRLMELWREL